MRSQVITFDNGEITARIELSEATILQGARRSRLRFEAEAESDPDRRLVRLLVYPDLIAAARSIEISGIDGVPSFDQFAVLPEALAVQWERVTFELNPHWLPSDNDEKKGAN